MPITKKALETRTVSFKVPSLSIFKSGNYTPILVILLIIASFLIGVLFTKVSYLEGGAGTNTAGTNAGDQAGTPPQAPPPGTKVDVKAGHLPSLGNKDAKVTVIEFSDFQCPFCKQLFDSTLPQLKSDYVDTGKIKFIYRHYPLTAIHPNALKAAMASECANDQDKFWEYHDKLFTSQDEWASLAAQAASDKLKEYAQVLGLNAGNFNPCLDSDKFKDKVDEDLSDGTAAGVNGTPATFVNGVLISGAVPYTQFKSAIDSELAK